MNLDLTHKTALVCGASQGLGAATATELALLGANVIVLARNESKLQSVVSRLDASKGQQHHYIVADTSRLDDLQQKITAYIREGNIIHILVNNSGGPPPGPMISTKPEDLESAFRAHLGAAHLLTQLLLDGMKKSGYGRIVNIVSTSVKQPINGLGISNTVRSAVANWAKTLANEIAHGGITVNNVLPGYTRTDRLSSLFAKQAAAANISVDEVVKKSVESIPAGRLGEPEEFGAAVAFLCTAAAAYINGINLVVDGGKTGSL